MRQLQIGNLLAIIPSLLLCFLNTPTTCAYSLPPNQYRPLPSSPLQVPHSSSRQQDSKTFLTRWRDRVIETVWSIPRIQCQNGKITTDEPASKAPTTLLSRYGGDMVLRFNISSVIEAKALAEAIDVLILDVWEFTANWVDIRLSKDVVSRD